MRKLFLSGILVVLTLFSVQAQIGLSAGPGLTYGFTSGQLFKSLHLGIEIPRNEEASIIIRFAGSLRNSTKTDAYATAIDPAVTSPSQVETKVRNSVSLFYLEGGTRRYFGTGFDYGFALYGGSLINVGFYRLSSKLDDSIDESLYTIDQTNRGSAFLLNFGLQGGVKKQFVFGTIFADVSLTYAIIATTGANTTVANNDYTNILSPLNLNFSIGIRRDMFYR